MTSLDTILKRFESPDEVREFEKGRLEIVRIAGQTLGRATYQPGWNYIPPDPHDSWVVGDEPYVSLHLLGADKYAR